MEAIQGSGRRAEKREGLGDSPAFCAQYKPVLSCNMEPMEDLATQGQGGGCGKTDGPVSLRGAGDVVSWAGCLPGT